MMYYDSTDKSKITVNRSKKTELSRILKLWSNQHKIFQSDSRPTTNKEQFYSQI